MTVVIVAMDPTQRGDMVAALVRRWYETNRESWWDRHRTNAERKGGVADNFMIGLVNEAYRVQHLSDLKLYEETGS